MHIKDSEHKKIDDLIKESYDLRNADVPRSFELCNIAYDLSEKSNYILGKARALCNLGFAHAQLSNYTEATTCLNNAHALFLELDNQEGLALILYNFGVIFLRLGDMNQSLSSQSKSLEIREKIGDVRGTGNCLFQIAFIQYRFKEFDLCLEFSLRGLTCSLDVDDKNGAAGQYMLRGMCYSDMGQKDLALEQFNNSMQIHQTINDLKGYGTLLYALGNHHNKYNELQLAKEYLIKATETAVGQNDTVGKVRCAAAMTDIFIKLAKFDSAKKSAEQGISDAENKNLKSVLPDLYKSMATIEEHLSNFESTVKWLKKYQAASDEVFNTDAAIKIKHNDILRKMESANMEAEINRLKNVELKKAYDEITHKNKEIVDSINYAKRLQEAILPPKNFIEKHLSNSFILYKPKDIVAGDFYWMETSIVNGEQILFIAAADCTGHGVPGAIVSVVCSNALKRTVKEFGLSKPGEILDKTRELVIETFEKSESEVKDGMDISLCAIPQFNSISNSVALHWSGANNPLWVIKSDQLYETCAHKQPIGKTDNASHFPTHQIELNKGDLVYLFTDGYPDQFGGPKGKKYKYKQLSDLLLSIASFSMEEQKEKLNQSIENWKGDLEQVDDICIIGIKF